MAKLVVINQGLAGLSFELSENWAVIGRGNGNAFQIIETSVSSKHCEVRLKDNDLHIRDIGSTNGTFVRGQKVVEAVLKPGQTLRFGQVEVRFEAESSAPAAQKPPAVPVVRPVVHAVPVVPVIPVVAPVPKVAAAAPVAPVVAAAAPVIPPVVPTPKVEGNGPPGKHFHILFVDDNEGFLAMFTELCSELSHKQWEIHIASTADRALEVLRRQSMDLVVLDIGMPLVDGIQLLSIIKRRYHDLKVAILTATATDAHRTTCLTGGAEIFIEKPTVADGFKVVFNMLNDLVSWTQHREGFSGTVRQVGLQEVIQMECLGRHSSVLEIRNQQTNGQIFIESGALVHAETADLSGEKALQLLLSLSGGEFRLLQFRTPKGRTINGSWEFLLMEAARLRDEEHFQADTAKKAVAESEATEQALVAADKQALAAAESDKQAQTDEAAKAKAVVVAPAPAAVTAAKPAISPAPPAPTPATVAVPVIAPVPATAAAPAPVGGGNARPAVNFPKMADAGSPEFKSPEAHKTGDPKKDIPADSNVHSLGEDIVIVATYDGKWHPSVTPKKKSAS